VKRWQIHAISSIKNCHVLPPDMPELGVLPLHRQVLSGIKGFSPSHRQVDTDYLAAMSRQAQLPWVWITTGAHTFQPLAVFEYLAHNARVCLMLG